MLLALDDVQWLDPASEEALAFAVRRLPPQLSLLVARRGEPGAELPLGLARALPEDRVERVAPAPLSFAALHELVRNRVGLSLSRPVLGQLAESSGGNPFFALEMARAYASRPDERDPGEPLPVPRSIEELVAAHVGRLSEDCAAGRAGCCCARRTRRRRSSPVRSEMSSTSARLWSRPRRPGC